MGSNGENRAPRGMLHSSASVFSLGNCDASAEGEHGRDQGHQGEASHPGGKRLRTGLHVRAGRAFGGSIWGAHRVAAEADEARVHGLWRGRRRRDHRSYRWAQLRRRSGRPRPKSGRRANRGRPK